jgi:hypothetical protein
VPRGKLCGCVCPSCNLRVIAKKGEVREWHFAHSFDKVDRKVQPACEYSAFVALRRAIWDVLPSLRSIDVPSASPAERKSGVRSVELERVEVGAKFAGIRIDAVAQVQSYSLAIYVTYPSRPLPPELRDLNTPRSGVLEICLALIPKVEASGFGGLPSGRALNSMQAVSDWLKHDLSTKIWAHHPRATSAETRVTTTSICVDQGPKESVLRFKCVVCSKEWSGPNSQLGRTCPECCTHLYTRELSN